MASFSERGTAFTSFCAFATPSPPASGITSELASFLRRAPFSVADILSNLSQRTSFPVKRRLANQATSRRCDRALWQETPALKPEPYFRQETGRLLLKFQHATT